MLTQVAHGVGMADKEIDPVADGICRGLMAGIENEDAVVDQLELAQAIVRVAERPLPLSPGRCKLAGSNQLGEDFPFVRVRFPHAATDQITQKGLELVDGAGATGELLGRKHRLESAEDSQRPLPQRAALVSRHAQHVADQLERNRRSKIADQVHAAAHGGAVEQLSDQRFDARLQCPERAGREGRRQQFGTRLW